MAAGWTKAAGGARPAQRSSRGSFQNRTTRGAAASVAPGGEGLVEDALAGRALFQRQDGASFLRPQMSSGKAYAALAVGMGGRRVEAIARERPHLTAGVSDLSGGKILPVVGGVLIRDAAAP